MSHANTLLDSLVGHPVDHASGRPEMVVERTEIAALARWRGAREALVIRLEEVTRTYAQHVTSRYVTALRTRPTPDLVTADTSLLILGLHKLPQIEKSGLSATGAGTTTMTGTTSGADPGGITEQGLSLPWASTTTGHMTTALTQQGAPLHPVTMSSAPPGVRSLLSWAQTRITVADVIFTLSRDILEAVRAVTYPNHPVPLETRLDTLARLVWGGARAGVEHRQSGARARREPTGCGGGSCAFGSAACSHARGG